MSKGIYKIIKDNKSFFLSIIVTFLIGTIIILTTYILLSKTKIKTVDDELYLLKYDSTWHISDKSRNKILFKHKSNSFFELQINELDDENKYAEIDELIDEILYNIQGNNPNFKLISKQKDIVTKVEINGYKLLYEDDTKQEMIVAYKKSNRLVLMRYEATNEYFDILLDSVESIIYNSVIKEDNFGLKNSLSINVDTIQYSTDEELDKLLTTSTNYEIANNNYLIDYSIPDNFTLNAYDSTSKTHSLKLDNSSIDISLSIINENIYEYLDKDETRSVYNNYKYYHNDDNDEYLDFSESLSKLDSDFNSYIYKNSYYTTLSKYFTNSNNQEDKVKSENVEMIYSLDKNRLLIIKISARRSAITEKLVNMIKINSASNYASYITSKKDNGFLISEFKEYTDYNRDSLQSIVLKIPDKYTEIDKKNNIYINKHYGIDFNDKYDLYNYEINYEISKISIESYIESINSIYIKSTYGSSEKMSYKGDLTVNGNKFQVYTGGYTEISGIMFTNIDRELFYINKMLLVYSLPNKDNFIIHINGNGKEITDSIINDVTNFNVSQIDI